MAKSAEGRGWTKRSQSFADLCQTGSIKANRAPRPMAFFKTGTVCGEETTTFFSLAPGDPVSKSRSRSLTTARHVAMYLMRELTGLSLIKIGSLFERDHTTALHGIKKIEGLMPARGNIYRQVQELTKRIRARGRSAA